jgi:hypothetical protein
MDIKTILAGLDFSHARLLGTLDTIEKSGQDPRKVLGWRPGPGRAHIGWQAMHCAATHDRYLNAGLRQTPLSDEAHVATYAGGSTPSDQSIPTFAQIREKLSNNFEAFRSYVAGLSADDLAQLRPGAGGKDRSIGESLILLTWHEAHHQGQIHLTWNLYKQAHGIK